MITMDVNTKAVSAAILSFQKKAPNSVKEGLRSVADEVLRLSQFEVPHREGTLQNSGAVDEMGDDFVVGYHTPYAARLHEHPEYHFQGGRKGKYLEDPIRRNASVLGITFGRTVQTRLF